MTTTAAAQKKGGSAFLQSLLIPGWGQYSLGETKTALLFFGAEVALVGGLLTVQSYGELTRDDYEALAAAHAGVTGDHDHDYYVDVGNWLTVNDFNNQRLLERNYASLYTDPVDFWYWDSEEKRAEMEKLRIRSDRAFNSVLYFAAGMALNHLASAIHAGRRAATMNDAEEDLGSLNERPQRPQVSWAPMVKADAVGINLHCKF
jgi:hypothetical protein